MKRLSKAVLGFLVCLLPLCLVFSYYPVISFGTGETMNFELSVPLLWLVVFDAVGGVVLVKEKKTGEMKAGKWSWKWLMWVAVPIFATVSLLWSDNLVRGILTCGVMWLIVLAIFIMVRFKMWFAEAEFRKKFWKWFLGSTLFVCVWCVVQCILDVVGVPREYSLMCAGCSSWSFGFPHPNGFAVEPQFMGNLLLAPAIVAAFFLMTKAIPISDALKGARPSLRSSMGLALVFMMVTATLFLVFSRGAIYAFGVGLVFLSVFVVVGNKKKWKDALRRVGMVWGVMALAFLFALNLQGIMAQVGPTNDTYGSGVAKVLNQLSLGIIDIRDKKTISNANGVDDGVVEKPVENFEAGMEEQVADGVALEGDIVDANKEAIFDGYVEESTEIRKMMTRNALRVWSQDLKTMMFGVGLGGAGEAMYKAGVTDWPKEIVQNEYVNVLLELGLVGVITVVMLIIMMVRVVVRKSARVGMVLTLMVAYGVSLMFFSGFANALQIYLLPAIFFVM